VKVVWSIILLIGISLAICAAYFFGHGLSAHDSKWFLLSGLCLVGSIGVLFAVIRFDRHTPDATHRH
jgi:hypothetical protein